MSPLPEVALLRASHQLTDTQRARADGMVSAHRGSWLGQSIAPRMSYGRSGNPGSVRPAAVGCLRTRTRRSSRQRPRTSWPPSSPCSSSSSSRSCSSCCSGWCTSFRRRSPTSGTIRSSRPSGRCACCRSCLGGCSGRWRGCGRIRSRSSTRWRTAPTSFDAHDGARTATIEDAGGHRAFATGWRGSRATGSRVRADRPARRSRSARGEVRRRRGR